MTDIIERVELAGPIPPVKDARGHIIATAPKIVALLPGFPCATMREVRANLRCAAFCETMEYAMAQDRGYEPDSEGEDMRDAVHDYARRRFAGAYCDPALSVPDDVAAYVEDMERKYPAIERRCDEIVNAFTVPVTPTVLDACAWRVYARMSWECVDVRVRFKKGSGPLNLEKLYVAHAHACALVQTCEYEYNGRSKIHLANGVARCDFDRERI
jgi:hypothetical protein